MCVDVALKASSAGKRDGQERETSGKRGWQERATADQARQRRDNKHATYHSYNKCL